MPQGALTGLDIQVSANIKISLYLKYFTKGNTNAVACLKESHPLCKTWSCPQSSPMPIVRQNVGATRKLFLCYTGILKVEK